MPEQLPLEPDLIKTLAADTRRDILSLLRDRRMTVTELARELDLGKATVHEHLDKLTGAGLVERHEDDRLWVYYGLTPRGKRLLNPDRTRFYLALASSVVAAIVAGLAVYAFMATGGIGFTSEDMTERAADRMLTPTQEEIYAGEAVELPAEGDTEGAHAYLVDEDSADRIREGDYDVQGLPLRAYAPSTAEAGDLQAGDETTLLRSDASLTPGTYYLYVRSGENDNAEAMPAVRLVGLEARADRSTWYQHLDEGPLTVDVTREGEPLAGQLRLAGPQGTSASASITSEGAKLPAQALDRLEPGSYEITVQPEDRARWIATDAEIEIRPSPFTAVPLHVDEHEPAPVRVHLDGPDRLRQQAPQVQGAQATVEATDTGWTVQLTDPEPGPASLSLARTNTSLEVHPSLAVDATVDDGPEIRWQLTDDGEPLADAAVYLDADARGFTDANGTLVTDMLDEGPHRLTVHRPDGATITRALTVDGWRISQPRPSVAVEPVDVASTPVSADITLAVTNDARVDQPLTLVADLAGTPAASQSLTVPAQQTLTTELTVPVDLGRHEVTVHAQPLPPSAFTYANETTTEEDGASGSDGEDTDDANDDGANRTAESDSADDTRDRSSTTVGTRTYDAYAEEGSEGDGSPAATDGDGAGDGAASRAPEAGPLEPVRPRTAAADAEGQPEQTPLPGVLLAFAVLAGAALWARARKP